MPGCSLYSKKTTKCFRTDLLSTPLPHDDLLQLPGGPNSRNFSACNWLKFWSVPEDEVGVLRPEQGTSGIYLERISSVVKPKGKPVHHEGSCRKVLCEGVEAKESYLPPIYPFPPLTTGL